MSLFGVSSELEREAEESLNELSSRVRSGISNRFSETAESADRFVRDRLKESTPDSVSSLFPKNSSTLAPFRRESSYDDNSGYDSNSSTDEDLPAALRAIRDGLDPFVD